MFSRSYFLALAVLVFLGCAAKSPQPMKPAEFSCVHCHMSIVDMPFKAEVISPKGKRYHFDSIECMVAWSQGHRDQVGTQWVTNYYQPSQWIQLSQAKIMVGDKIMSPMGGHLAAVATEEEWQRAQTEFGGRDSGYGAIK